MFNCIPLLIIKTSHPSNIPETPPKTSNSHARPYSASPRGVPQIGTTCINTVLFPHRHPAPRARKNERISRPPTSRARTQSNHTLFRGGWLLLVVLLTNPTQRTSERATTANREGKFIQKWSCFAPTTKSPHPTNHFSPKSNYAGRS